ncbi:MAG: CoA-binding protein [Flavobacteriales bacterium]|nr:CoA-binding protein [Flavobacteriales bacterium]
MTSKATLVLGASLNEMRYSNLAVKLLKEKGFEVIAVGRDTGDIEGIEILHDQPELENIDTVTLYIGPNGQPQFYDYILGLKPRRIIMNPGTENNELERLAKQKGIEVEIACTLVMLRVGNYF